jgi:DNA-binding CsgD family transcriptional regulator
VNFLCSSPIDRLQIRLLTRSGRPKRLIEAQKTEARRRAEGATLAELARSYDVSMSTISRL